MTLAYISNDLHVIYVEPSTLYMSPHIYPVDLLNPKPLTMNPKPETLTKT